MVGELLTGLSDSDVLFLVETVDPRLVGRIDAIRGDPGIVEGMLEQEAGKVFERIMLMGDERLMARMTPRFLFEVLLRRALSELRGQSYTLERTASQRIPVFDSGDVVELLANRAVLKYLADMLSSFTKVQSYTLPVRVRRGIWRKIRFSDMDIDGLMRLCETVKEEQRFSLYKRIADLCLFIVGMFPEYVSSGRDSALGGGKGRRSAEDYEEEGRRFYRLAGEHRAAGILELADVLWQLHDKFNLAKKPLNYVSDKYLQFRKRRMFSDA